MNLKHVILHSFHTCCTHVPKHSRGLSIAGDREVMLKYGLRPSQLADLVGLMGDAADNIPGVKGVGLKSGAALLQVVICNYHRCHYSYNLLLSVLLLCVIAYHN
jgi:5'-3' exonuclease, C-terminal SAM fold